jgi:hypothetical protein
MVPPPAASPRQSRVPRGTSPPDGSPRSSTWNIPKLLPNQRRSVFHGEHQRPKPPARASPTPIRRTLPGHLPATGTPHLLFLSGQAPPRTCSPTEGRTRRRTVQGRALPNALTRPFRSHHPAAVDTPAIGPRRGTPDPGGAPVPPGPKKHTRRSRPSHSSRHCCPHRKSHRTGRGAAPDRSHHSWTANRRSDCGQPVRSPPPRVPLPSLRSNGPIQPANGPPLTSWASAFSTPKPLGPSASQRPSRGRVPPSNQATRLAQ